MKSRDQKKLEKIYESMIDGEFVFLEEEKQFAKLCAEQLYETLMDEAENTGFDQQLYPIFDILYHVLDSPSNPSNPVYRVVPKLNLGSISEKFRTFYDVFVQRELAKHTYVGKKRQKDKGTLVRDLLEFHDPYDDFNIEQVMLVDSEKVIETLEKHLKIFIKLTFTDKYVLKDILNTNPDWKEVYQWREEKLKFQKLKDKLPEIEGLFESKKRMLLKEAYDYVKAREIEKEADQHDREKIHSLNGVYKRPEVQKILHLIEKCVDDLSTYRYDTEDWSHALANHSKEIRRQLNLTNEEKDAILLGYNNGASAGYYEEGWLIEFIEDLFFPTPEDYFEYVDYLEREFTKLGKLKKKLPEIEGLFE